MKISYGFWLFGISVSSLLFAHWFVVVVFILMVFCDFFLLFLSFVFFFVFFLTFLLNSLGWHE